MSTIAVGRMTRAEWHGAIAPINVGAREAAAMLGISLRTLQTETTDGSVPSFKIRGRRLYNVQELQRISLERSQQATA
jgi:hypothetical protein